MTASRYLGRPGRLLVLFVVLGGLPLTVLGWLAWRLLDQDRILERQRNRERLENAAGLLARESDRALARWEELLPHATPPAGSVVLVFSPKGIVRREGM